MLLGCLVSGYTLHGGSLNVLVQPYAALIICGAVLGSLLLGAPGKILQPRGRSIRRNGNIWKSIKLALVTYRNGAAPIVAVEYVRRLLLRDGVHLRDERPSASELESAVKKPHRQLSDSIAVKGGSKDSRERREIHGFDATLWRRP